MRKETVEVTWHAGKTDMKKGNTEFMIFDNLADAGTTLGDATATGLLNVQVKTKAMNDYRKQWEPKEGKQVVRNKAMAMVKPDEWVAAAGDQGRIDEVINKYVAILENEAASKAGTAGTAPATDVAAAQAAEEEGAQNEQDANQ